nr:class B sortase [uncultured Acetatifactor sp.]
MAQKIFVVEDRQFRTESDYACAKRDKQLIDKLRQETDFEDKEALEALLKNLRGGKYKFMTLLGQDFRDEVEMAWKKSIPGKKSAPGKQAAPSADSRKTRRGKAGRQAKPGGEKRTPAERTRRNEEASGREKGPGSASGRRNDQAEKASDASDRDDAELEEIVEQELRKREKRRKLILLACSAVAICCLGYFVVYSYYDYRTQSTYEELSELKEKPVIAPAVTPAPGPLYTLDGEPAAKEVLEEYQNLLLKNRKLIGWVKIDDTYIDYPVMQTTDNEYYLDHNMNQEYDKNGTIFMDKDCDVLKPSTNFILYGHHMKNGRMFGQLDQYKNESFYKEHPLISFDTIYEKGTYQIMYVFRAKVYKETEIVFKYYQFIEANGEQEFDSAMEEMAALSLYDTGVTAQYGDQLLTLSTCDYQETDGRFVVVAKKISDGEQ